MHEGPFSEEAVKRAAEQLREGLGAPANVALAFVTPDYIPHIAEFSDIVRVDGHVMDVVGCTGSGLTSDGIEKEDGEGFSLLAVRSDDTEFLIRELPNEMVDRADGPDFWRRNVPAASSWILVTNPFGFGVDDWLVDWNAAFPGIPTVGGLASGGHEPDQIATFHNGQVIDGGMLVGLAGGSLRIVPLVSQGCRPIGEPLPVTRAEDNVIFALGSRPAYQALESAFQSLTETERSHAQGNLFAGLANNEYVDDFRPGDFMIRNIIGADPDSGAVVIAGIPRVGQTVQYQIRDRESAGADLRRVLQTARSSYGAPLGTLLFCCTGRGADFFGKPNHDAEMMESVLGAHPSAGVFCNGEIGPLGGRNCVHGYTASCAMFVEDNS